jgi:hypothetical protein
VLDIGGEDSACGEGGAVRVAQLVTVKRRQSSMKITANLLICKPMLMGVPDKPTENIFDLEDKEFVGTVPFL